MLFSNKFNCKGRNDLCEFLWADYKKGIWTGEYLSDLLKIHTSKNNMRALGLREYRKIAVAFMGNISSTTLMDFHGRVKRTYLIFKLDMLEELLGEIMPMLLEIVEWSVERRCINIIWQARHGTSSC